MNILFVTSRNAYNTCGELRLIKNRAEVLKREYGFDTEFVVFKTKKVLKKPQEQIENDGFKLFTYSMPNYLGALASLKDYVVERLKAKHFDLVICSGIQIMPVVGAIKKYNKNQKVVADIHGTENELIEFNPSNIIKRSMRHAFYHYGNYVGKKYLNMFDGYLCVSHALREHVIEKYKVTNDNFFIVPCAIDFKGIDKENAMVNRTEIRNKYGIREDEIVFIYSGGTSPWQCIDESVAIYHKLKREFDGKKTRLCLFSGNLDALKKYEAEDVVIDSLPAALVPKTLNAGDYAFMLRGNFVTNNVAYPNKFLEYIAGGLNVIATPHVHDVRDQILEYGVGIIVDLDGSGIDKIKQSYHEYLSDAASREHLLNNTCFTHTLKPLVEFVNS